MAFSVAMNSKRSNAVVALLIASNFAEIKGVVLKRFDPRRLLVLSFQVRTLSGVTIHVLCNCAEVKRGAGAPRPAAPAGPFLPGPCPIWSAISFRMFDAFDPSGHCPAADGVTDVVNSSEILTYVECLLVESVSAANGDLQHGRSRAKL